MKPHGGRVLVVDEDWSALESLANALRARGHSVSLATDGRAGLTRASEVAAEVVLVDEGLPVLDLRTFFDVIRDDPRTRGAHLFVMGHGDPARLAALDARAEAVVKPFHAGEVAARIDELIRADHAPADARELRGDLDQVALFDLLQVFAANGRTGRLTLTTGDTEATLWVDEGDVVDATTGGVTGEKAAYRALAVTHGSFVFTPTSRASRQRFRLRVSALLMEAARRADEQARLMESLPPRRALVARALDVRPEEALQAEIMRHLARPLSIGELTDRSSAHDLETLSALAELIREGAVEVLAARLEEVDFAPPDEALVLGVAASELKRPGLEGVGRVGVLAADRQQVAAFARALGGIHQFRPSADPPVPASASAFGALGTLTVGAARVELFLLPQDASSAPLVAAFMSSGRALLALSASTVSKEVLELSRELGVRLVVAEPGWETPSGAVHSLRGLFQVRTARRDQAAPR